MKNKKSVFGFYRNSESLKRAVEAIQNFGFAGTDILVLEPNQKGKLDFAYQLRMNVRRGAIIGGVLGFVVLGLLMLLAVLSVVPVLDATPLTPGAKTLLACAGFVFGAIFGAISGALVGIGTPESPTERYGIYSREGGYILSVHFDQMDRGETARNMMYATGAEDISVLNEDAAHKQVLTEARNAG